MRASGVGRPKPLAGRHGADLGRKLGAQPVELAVEQVDGRPQLGCLLPLSRDALFLFTDGEVGGAPTAFCQLLCLLGLFGDGDQLGCGRTRAQPRTLAQPYRSTLAAECGAAHESRGAVLVKAAFSSLRVVYFLYNAVPCSVRWRFVFFASSSWRARARCGRQIEPLIAPRIRDDSLGRRSSREARTWALRGSSCARRASYSFGSTVALRAAAAAAWA